MIVVLNNDVEVQHDFLANIVKPLTGDPRVGTVAALLVRPGGQIIDTMGLAADRTLAGFARLRGRPASEAASSSPVLVGPSGAGGAYRRSAWSDVKGLDEGVHFYGEDLDLAVHASAAQDGKQPPRPTPLVCTWGRRQQSVVHRGRGTRADSPEATSSGVRLLLPTVQDRGR